MSECPEIHSAQNRSGQTALWHERGSPSALHLQLLRLYLEQLQSDGQLEQLDALAAQALQPHQQAVLRLAQVPGFDPDSAQRLMAEVGPAAAFEPADQFASEPGMCPGSNISAQENQSTRSPKGNRYVRHLLTQAAHAAVKTKGSFFQALVRCFLLKLKYAGAIWAVAHRLARVVWKILHEAVPYIERGSELDTQGQEMPCAKDDPGLTTNGPQVVITPAGLQGTTGAA